MTNVTGEEPSPVYVDCNATTPVAAEVLAAMAPFWQTEFYNPSASYASAHRARHAVEDARAAVAHLLGSASETIVFTSGGTESNNGVFWGTWLARHAGRRRIVISSMEHPSVLESAKALQALGAEVIMIPVDSEGVIRVDTLEAVITEDTALVSVMLANNEVGTIQPVAAVSERAHAVGAWMHTDAAQAVGKMAVDVTQLGVDFLTLAGHKWYAPKGIGALYIHPHITLPPFLVGGGQEQGHRSGTEPVPLVVGLGRAAQLAAAWLAAGGVESQAARRDRLETQILQLHPQVRIFGRRAARLPNTVAMAYPGWDGPSLLAACPTILAGTGSACHSAGTGSSTLQAMGYAPSVRRGLVRLSLGRETTDEELVRVVEAFRQALASSSFTPIPEEE